MHTLIRLVEGLDFQLGETGKYGHQRMSYSGQKIQATRKVMLPQ